MIMVHSTQVAAFIVAHRGAVGRVGYSMHGMGAHVRVADATR